MVLDECGTHTSLTPLYGYAPRNQRLRARVPRNRGENVTLLCALTTTGFIAEVVFNGALNQAIFETYVEQVLAPALVPGQIVIWDNLNVHKSARARQIIEAKGCQIVFLPAYSPDFSPIELAFSQLKAYLKRVGQRAREALVAAIGEALTRLTSDQARAFFTHCGYSPPVL